MKLTVVRQVKFAVFHGNGTFVTLSTRARHWPRPDSNEFSTYSDTLKLILIVPHPCLRFLLSLGLPFSFSFHNFVRITECLHYATCTAHLILFDLIIAITFREA